MTHELVTLSAEVADALAQGRPVVALESTVIAHGLPYPANVETAVEIEKAVRGSGTVPATIGLVDGRFAVGMDDALLERFASTERIPKVSARDVGPILAGGGLGATTVASSVIAADLAGIRVFSTAGIGGVHRGAERTFDVSADLIQFTRSRVAVVCAGAKSVLDLGLTLEYLETQGVPVIGYRCTEFPAFYLRGSGLPNPQRMDDLDLVARAVRAHWATGTRVGALVTHPISEAAALEPGDVDGAIAAALAEADREGIAGPAITPFLMKKVSLATKGISTAANRAVLISTAAVAGQLAVALGPDTEPGR
jgi:pseudouridylate synthase